MTVLDVGRGLVRHPVRHLLKHWNWKHAAFTALVRGGIFFAVNLAAGWRAATRALAVDALFRIPLSGVYASITQALYTADPPWAVALVTVGAVPAAGHALELAVHWIGGTAMLRTSVLVSIGFSALSAVFNLFSMRRGAFLV